VASASAGSCLVRFAEGKKRRATKRLARVVWLFQMSEPDGHDNRQRVARKEPAPDLIRGPSHQGFAGKAASRALRPSAVATATVTRVAPHDLRLFRLKRAPHRVIQRLPSVYPPIVFSRQRPVAVPAGIDCLSAGCARWTNFRFHPGRSETYSQPCHSGRSETHSQLCHPGRSQTHSQLCPTGQNTAPLYFVSPAGARHIPSPVIPAKTRHISTLSSRPERSGEPGSQARPWHCAGT